MRDNIRWLPPESYRRWRDIGIRGYGDDGLPTHDFRVRWSGRNTSFCDLMVRTGLRLAEQSALTLMDLPSNQEGQAYQRFWLPVSIAKGRSARWIYIPRSIARDLSAYIDIDRRQVIEEAQASRVYERWKHPLIVEDPSRPVIVKARDGVVTRVSVKDLVADERRQVLVERKRGLEPASLWLGEGGAPLTDSRWKSIFKEANGRCKAAGSDLRAHAHMLRHTFAVVTLEQLQRGHIAAMAAAEPEQRGHYTRIFGDPLDWVRRRLGHRSITTTMVYLHALGELEMETRMALVPDEWEDIERVPEHGPSE